MEIKKLVDCWEVDREFRLYDRFLGDSSGFLTLAQWREHNRRFPKGFLAPNLQDLTYVFKKLTQAQINDRSRDSARAITNFLEAALVESPIGTVSHLAYNIGRFQIIHPERKEGAGKEAYELNVYPIGVDLLKISRKEVDTPENEFGAALFGMPIQDAAMAYYWPFDTKLRLAGKAKREEYCVPRAIQLTHEPHNKTMSIDASIAPETAYRTIGVQFL